ncbi:MAG: hypothetical protein COX79_04795 [Candidatus Levybacteria bacterium CG_4_10_14_0_2_um_filter_36_16]|nr:MAG: hypothetical protein AUK12_00570 [Candidatus Levybacteria bacterium CG2_30_37_29]PIZ96560.1 MAG: hypothetical protein COX79_04795 [Candidatus Levybacteria bacterium CG_4_10_14_0_2_um_filter_36_16]
MKLSKKFIEINKDYYKHIEEYDWVEVTDHYRGLESFFHKLREFLVVRKVKKYGAGDKYLDAGCGTGLILRHLPKGAVGIDINPRNISKAKKHAPNAKIVEGDIEKMPFKDKSFSTIVCTEVIEHQPNPAPTVNELYRVLEKGGVLIGSVPSASPIWFLRFLSSTCPRGEPFHKNFKKDELAKLFKDFEIISLKRSVMGMSYFFVLKKV